MNRNTKRFARDVLRRLSDGLAIAFLVLAYVVYRDGVVPGDCLSEAIHNEQALTGLCGMFWPEMKIIGALAVGLVGAIALAIGRVVR